MIAETDFKKTTAEILEIYRRRDVIEKSVDNLKNGLDMKRLRSHSTQTELDKVKMICAADRPGGCRLLNPSAKVQREILACLGLPVNSFDVFP